MLYFSLCAQSALMSYRSAVLFRAPVPKKFVAFVIGTPCWFGDG